MVQADSYADGGLPTTLQMVITDSGSPTHLQTIISDGGPYKLANACHWQSSMTEMGL